MKGLNSLIVLLLVSLPSWAQGSVTIFGTITDAAGAVAPGVSVKVTNTQTGSIRTSVSGPTGDYVVVQLPVGIYSVQGQAAGFKVYIEPDIHVQVGENRRVDIRLEVGDITQNVTVKADVAQVETRSGTIREVIDSHRITELPLNGRNALQLQLLVPGFTGVRVLQQEQNDAVMINGSTSRSNNYTLDGGDNHDPFFNTSAPLPNPDALQEFSMSINAYPADQGRNAGIIVNAVTKSGTNQFHGALFEFLRNKELNARAFFAAGRPPFKRNQYGGAIGGPILIPGIYNGKDKTFFFFSYQGTRERSTPNILTATVLSPAQRGGDFSALTRQLNDPNGGIFPGNIIPASRLSQPAQKFLNAFVPLSNRPNNLLTFDSGAGIDDDQSIIKIDHQLSTANRVSGRLLWAFNDNKQTAGATLPGFLSIIDYSTRNLTVTDTHVLSPTLLNTFTFSRNDILREQLPSVPGNASWEDFGAGVRRAQVGDTPVAHSDSVTGYFNAFTRIPLYQLRVGYQFSDQVSLTRHTHQIRFGFDLRRYTTDRFERSGNPNLTFIDRFTGNAGADFVLGRMNDIGQGSPNVWLPQGNEYGAYIQDDWRASRRLTLNLGLRWDPFTPTPDRQGLEAIFIPGRQSTYFPLAPPGLIFAQDPGVPPSTIHKQWKDFGPRFGFAVDPFGDGRTSLRGGYGIFFGQLFGQAFSIVGPAVALRISIDGPPGGLADPYSSLPGGFPFPYNPPQTAAERTTFRFPQQLSLRTYSPDYRNAIEQHWNFNIQRQFFQSYILTVSYVGSKGNHLDISNFQGGDIQANPALPGTGAVQARRIYNPYFSSIGLEASSGNNLFHSAQVNLNKRFSNGFSILASYTFANLLADLVPGDSLFDHSKERGRDGVKHRYVGSFIWDLPKLTGQPAIMRQIAGGWEANGIVTLQSGGYLTVTSGRDNNNNGNTADRPDVVGNPFLDVSRPRGELIARYFNAAAFVQNGPNSLGGAGRGILEGPGLASVDFGLFKNFQIAERFGIQFRAEFFNFLNRPNLGNPNTNIAAATVGQISSSGDPRVVQMALKFKF